jgi:hypothetical protein
MDLNQKFDDILTFLGNVNAIIKKMDEISIKSKEKRMCYIDFYQVDISCL